MTADHRLVFQGLFLILLALLTGLLLVAGPAFVVNPRGVMAGHVEGLMNGTFIIVVGLFFTRLSLSDRMAAICRGTLLYSGFMNWFITTLAGVLGASEATPLAGAGHHAGPFAERLVLFVAPTVAISILVAVVLLMIGVRRGLTMSPAIAPV